MSKLNHNLALSALLAAALATPAFVSAADDVSSAKGEKAEKKLKLEQDLPIYINQVLKPYTLLKKVSAEVYVTDAKSEEEAELLAFQKLKKKAKEQGADGLIEVRRSIIKDSIAVRATNGSSGSMLADDIDSTSVAIDELTLDDYNRNKGTLSGALIDDTFDRSKLSQKSVRFTGKAIKFD